MRLRLFGVTAVVLSCACSGQSGGDVIDASWSADIGVGDLATTPDASSGDLALGGSDLLGADAGNVIATTALALGFRNTCAISSAQQLKCWGTNLSGALGQGDTVGRGDGIGQTGTQIPRIDLGLGRSVKAVAAGVDRVCAILDDGSVKCWGRNNGGQLGLGDANDRGDAPGEMGDALPAIALGTGRTAKKIALGWNHTCAVLDDDSIKCWGPNGSGQLGLGDTSVRGAAAAEMGDNLLAVDLGPGRTARSVVAGYSHTCALLDDASVKCWGDNALGKLGLSIADANPRGDGANEMGSNLLPIALGAGRTVRKLASGDNHTCALLDNASVKCWGNNNQGQLGLGDTNARGDDANEMGDNLAAVALGAGRSAVDLAAGGLFTCARLDDGSTRCWGQNVFGQLGLGDVTLRGDSAATLGAGLAAVDLGPAGSATGIALGQYHACVTRPGGVVTCWGRNFNGQLGLGDTNDRGDAANEMGANLPTLSLW